MPRARSFGLADGRTTTNRWGVNMSDEPHYVCKPWCPVMNEAPNSGDCTCGAVRNLIAWRQGIRAGIRLWAWWKDGVQYVGTCGTPLDEALKRVDRLFPLQGFPEQSWEI